MYLWLISQKQNSGYDTYDSAVVVAPDEESAKRVHPSNGRGYLTPSYVWSDERSRWEDKGSAGVDWSHDWTDPLYVTAVIVGVPAMDYMMEGTVICASFNAG